IRREAELIHVAAGADEAELAAEAELDDVVELDAGADGHGQLVMPGGAARAEVEQVAALETNVARVAVHRVVLEVELDERIEAVQVHNVVAEVETAPQELAAFIVDAQRVPGSVEEDKAAV